MTVELARRLIESGIPLADIEAALLVMVARDISLLDALAERDPGLFARVEQLGRPDLPSVFTVRVSLEPYGRLPAGMCRRLLAVPVHVDPESGRVDLAAVEPLDPHVAQEFSFHLEQPVRLLAASYEAVTGALDGLRSRTKLSAPAAARGRYSSANSEAPIPLVKIEPGGKSDAPIPLVRRSLAPPPVTGHGPRPRRSPDSGGLSEAEGVALSWRSKPPPGDLVVRAAKLDRQAAEARAADARAPSQRPPPPALSARERLEEATTPEIVLDVLREALEPAASIVFAVKNASFEGRVASSSVEQRRPAKQISLLSHQPSVLETAVKSGFYLGPIPNTPNHRELRDALPADSVSEVYVTVVTVADRPSLVWLIAGFEQSLDLTRRADEIALAAGRALARILRQRKKG